MIHFWEEVKRQAAREDKKVNRKRKEIVTSKTLTQWKHDTNNTVLMEQQWTKKKKKKGIWFLEMTD